MIPILGGIFLSTRAATTDCMKFLQWPFIVIGVSVMVVSLTRRRVVRRLRAPGLFWVAGKGYWGRMSACLRDSSACRRLGRRVVGVVVVPGDSGDVLSKEVKSDREFAANAGGEERFRIICKSIKDYEGRWIIHCAAAAGKTQICKYLIETVQVNINEKNEEGDTPLLLATEMNHIPTTKYLLKHGANSSESNIKGTTALHHVTSKGNEKFMKLLISQGADIGSDSDFGTPLQHATSSGKKEAVRIWLDHKANQNRTLPISSSPVMLSILAESFDCLDMFLKAGADINAHSLGLLPLAFAASKS